MTRFVVVTLAVAFVMGTQARAADEGVRIGVVDMQKALQSVEAGKKAKAQLEKEFNAKKKELQNEEAAIKKLDEEFKKQALVLNEESKVKKQNEIRERIMKAQEQTGRWQMEIQQKERELTEPLIEKIRGIVKDMAGKKGYTVVLEKNENTVLFSLEKDDLTTEVISTFNKANKG